LFLQEPDLDLLAVLYFSVFGLFSVVFSQKLDLDLLVVLDFFVAGAFLKTNLQQFYCLKNLKTDNNNIN